MVAMPPPRKTDEAASRAGVSGPALTAKTAAPTTITQTRNDSNVGNTR
jgi:hypothetical protein